MPRPYPRKENSLLIWTFDQKRIFLVLSVQMKVAVCGREQMLKLFLRKWCPTVWRSMIPSSPLNGPPSGGRPVVWIGGLGPPLGWPPIMWGPKPASLPPGNGGIIGWSLRPGGPLANGGPPLVWWSRAGPMLWWWPSKIWLLLEAEMFSLSSLVPEPFLFKSAPSFEGDPCRLPIVRLCGKKWD